MADKPLLQVTVEDTDTVHFSDKADRVTSYNEMGRFDVFPMHANFISLITTQLDIYQDKKKIKEFKIDQAVLKVKKNDVHVFLGIEKLLVDEDFMLPVKEKKQQTLEKKVR